MDFQFFSILCLNLLFYYLNSFYKGLVHTCRILTTSLCHVWTSAAATAYKSGDRFDQITCMRALLLGFVCSSCH